MEKFVVKGGNKLNGTIDISGSKNSAVALIPASILIDGECTIENVPNIKDVVVLQNILHQIGVEMEFTSPGAVRIDSRNINTHIADSETVQEMRASYYLMGALLGRFGKATIPFPGGCNFGSRPIDQHLKGFEAMGAKYEIIEDAMIELTTDGGLVGASIFLDVVSVGATINIMLAAVTAKGTTTIENAAKEPHIVDLANFLNAMGANITGTGTDVIKIKGVKKLTGGHTYSTIPDQIEAGTYMIAAAVTEGDITVAKVIPKHMESLSRKLMEMGMEVIEDEDSIRVIGKPLVKTTNIKTLPYPGFPTDLHPQMTVLMGKAKGTSRIREEIWEERFQYADQLRKMGANIMTEAKMAFIQGPWKLLGAPVKATDLRAGITMVLAGLMAGGTTTISNIEYIDRGYEDLIGKLTGVGANIKRISTNGKS